MSSLPAASIFEVLPARPPTPPKDGAKEVDDALRFLSEGHDDPLLDLPATRPAFSTDTPPPSSPSWSHLPSSTTKKKVDFSPWPTYHDPSFLAAYHGGTSTPSSRPDLSLKATKPLKSILKSVHLPSPTVSVQSPCDGLQSSPLRTESFGSMLLSALKHLGTQSPSARLDAYLALNGTIRTYQGIPDPKAMIEHQGQLMRYCCRDIAGKDANDRMNVNIATQALQLIGNILLTPRMGPVLGDDVKACVVDRAIVALSCPETPKVIVKAFIFVLCQPHLASVLSITRAEKLVGCLQSVEDRWTGSSILSGRLLIYKRLVDQAPNTMLSKMREWLLVVLHGLVSPVRDVRSKAIESCMRAALKLGTQPHASRVMTESFELDTKDGSKYGQYISRRLTELSADADQAEQVPQIWAAVVLFFRSKRRPLESWTGFRGWLLIIQKCLNSTNLAVRSQANSAWNKLVFTVMPDSKTQETLRSMLRVPIMGSFDKRSNDKYSRQVREHGMSSYCNLLHYALRPALSHAELDQAWDMYVDPVLAKISAAGSGGRSSVCQILNGLLIKREGSWNVSAAVEPGNIGPGELPHIDPRWIRTRIAKFLKQLEHLAVSATVSLTEERDAIASVWRSLLRAVSEASGQEIKTSLELKAAIARMMDFFRCVWTASMEVSLTADDQTSWVNLAQVLVDAMVQFLHPNRLIEEILQLRNNTDIEVAPTPSHRATRHDPDTLCPLTFLYDLFNQSALKKEVYGTVAASAGWLLEICLRASPSTSAYMETLARTNDFSLTQASEEKTSIELANILWQAVAQRAIYALQPTSSLSRSSDCNFNDILESTLRILDRGLRLLPHGQSSRVYSQLLILLGDRFVHKAEYRRIFIDSVNHFRQTLANDSGDGPVMQSIWFGIHHLEHSSCSRLQQSGMTLEKPGTFSNAGITALTDDDTQGVMFGFIRELHHRAYERLPVLVLDPETILQHFVEATARSLQGFPCQHTHASSALLQDGLSVWLRDAGGLLFKRSSVPKPHDAMLASNATTRHTLANQIAVVWESFLVSLRDASHAELMAMETVLLAGVSSPSEQVASTTFEFWGSIRDRTPMLHAAHGLKSFSEACQRRLGPSSSSRTSTNQHEDSISAINPIDGLNTVHEFFNKSDLPQILPDRAMEKTCRQEPLLTVSELLSFPAESINPPVSATYDKEIHQLEPGCDVDETVSSTNEDVIQDNTMRDLDFDSYVTAGGMSRRELPITPVALMSEVMMSDDLPSSPTPRASANHQDLDIETVDTGERSASTDADSSFSSSPPRLSLSNPPRDPVGPDSTEQLTATPDDVDEVEEVLDIASPEQTSSVHAFENAEIEDRRASLQVAPEPLGELKQHHDSDPSHSCHSPQHDESLEDDRKSGSRGSKKRKRSSEVIYAPRKRKQQSPLKGLFSTLLGQRQGEDDEGVEDEIIVASSQSTAPMTLDECHEESPLTSEHVEEGIVEGLKRSRGRPRKTRPARMADVFPSPMILGSARVTRRSSKLRSNLNGASGADLSVRKVDGDVRPSAHGKILRGKRSGRRGSAAKDPGDASERQPQDDTCNGIDEDLNHDAEDFDESGPTRQLEQEQLAAAAILARPMAQPKSILARLKSVFQDCKNLWLAPQEVREFDDMLFEIRKEVHNAGERGSNGG